MIKDITILKNKIYYQV